MRVLHVTGIYPSVGDPHRGSFVRTQVESLVSVGVETEVCVLHGTGFGKYIRGISAVRSAVAAFQPDLLHAHYMYAGWTARLASHLPLVVSFMGNDVFGDPDPEGHYSWRTRALHMGFSNLLCWAAAHSIVKSEEMRDAIHCRRISLIPNGVDLSVFRPRFQDRSTIGLGPGVKYVLFAGRRRDPVKRFGLAQRAVDLLVKRHGIEAELLVVEGKRPEEVASIMNAVDCLLVTSAHEGSPNIVKEALACELPIVSVDVGDVRLRTKEVPGVEIVDPSEDAAAEALLRVLRRGGRLTKGRKAVEGISVGGVARSIQALYEAIVGQRYTDISTYSKTKA